MQADAGVDPEDEGGSDAVSLSSEDDGEEDEQEQGAPSASGEDAEEEAEEERPAKGARRGKGPAPAAAVEAAADESDDDSAGYGDGGLSWEAIMAGMVSVLLHPRAYRARRITAAWIHRAWIRLRRRLLHRGGQRDPGAVQRQPPPLQPLPARRGPQRRRRRRPRRQRMASRRLPARPELGSARSAKTGARVHLKLVDLTRVPWVPASFGPSSNISSKTVHSQSSCLLVSPGCWMPCF